MTEKTKNNTPFFERDWPFFSGGKTFSYKNPLRDSCQARWRDLLGHNLPEPIKSTLEAFGQSEKGRYLLAHLFNASPYLSDLLLVHPDWLADILLKPLQGFVTDVTTRIDLLCKEAHDSGRLMHSLRENKARLSLGLALWDITGLASLEEVTESLSIFAARAIDASLWGAFCRVGFETVPVQTSGLIVLGMGKLGAFELNYSSDIDLIFLYSPEKMAHSFGEKQIDKIPGLARRITLETVRILNEKTPQGYVFRTDLRLRPDPSSTPSAISTISAEFYYESRARNWERASFIKARPVAGDVALGVSFLKRLHPFVWRNHLDYASIEDIGNIKWQIEHMQEEAGSSGLNIKLAPGGIRSIEFYVQAHQLIRGGRIPGLRKRATLKALQALALKGFISTEEADFLTKAYIFLRTIEHRLQMVDDKQTHTLPATKEPREYLARFMGYEQSTAFYDELATIMAETNRYHQRLFQNQPEVEETLSLSFIGTENGTSILEKMNFKDTESIVRMVSGWDGGNYRALQTERARKLLEEIFPQLLRAFSQTAHPNQAIIIFDYFLSRLPAGIQWLSLFKAQPQLLTLLVSIMGDSPVLADMLRHSPHLIETVLEDIDIVESRSALLVNLSNRFGYMGHYEAKLDMARDWYRERRFLICSSLLQRHLSPEQACRALSDTAQTVLKLLQAEVLANFESNHGTIPGGQLATMAGGRLGGREMTINSDLDLVFVYSHPDGVEASSGSKKALTPSVYYQRLVQHLVTALSIPTSRGGLFEVDLRLRPFGTAGPLALNLEAFTAYYKKDARFWEFMALTRMRPVAGAPAFCRQMARHIREILQDFPMPKDTISAETAELREKIKETYPGQDFWDIRYYKGGLVDFEFTVQSLQLVSALEGPACFSLSIEKALRKLERAGFLTPSQYSSLYASWLFFTRIRIFYQLGVNSKQGEALSNEQKKLIANLSGYDSVKKLETAMQKVYQETTSLMQTLIVTQNKKAG